MTGKTILDQFGKGTLSSFCCQQNKHAPNDEPAIENTIFSVWVNKVLI